MGVCSCKEPDADIDLTKDQNINLSKDLNSKSSDPKKNSNPNSQTTGDNFDKNNTCVLLKNS